MSLTFKAQFLSNFSNANKVLCNGRKKTTNGDQIHQILNLVLILFKQVSEKVSLILQSMKLILPKTRTRSFSGVGVSSYSVSYQTWSFKKGHNEISSETPIFKFPIPRFMKKFLG